MLRRRSWASLAAFLLLLAGGLGSFGATPARVCAQALPSTVQVAMPDGVTLATDVWRPLLAQGKLPVLLRRTPYGRALDAQLAQVLAAQGVVLVSQDVRGRGDSQGTFEPFFDDQVDGRATMAWIAEQPWSNGRIATYGNSAEGIVQFMAMGDAPEALRCAHLGMPTHDVYEGIFPGGAWRTELGTQWLTDLGASDVVTLWKSHELRDAYWDDAILTTEEMTKVKHPVFIVGGMFDVFAHSQVRALRELQRHADPSAREDVFLLMGPWTHGGAGERVQGDVLYPEDAPYLAWADELLAYIRWCAQDGPRPDLAQVRYYQTEVTDEVANDPKTNTPRIVARGAWLQSSTWPPPESALMRLFVQSAGSLGDAPAQDQSVALPVDPTTPLPSLGGGNLSTAAGPHDQTPLDLLPEVFVAASAKVSAPTEVRGDLKLRLWASSATTDVDVIVRVEVLTALGKAVALADGIRRGRFAGGYDQRRPLSPGEPVRFDVDLGPLAVKLSPGQALRIAISGTSSPRYEPNPNVGDPLLDATPTATTLTIYTDDAHPSDLWVPVASGELPGAAPVPEEELPDAGVETDGSSGEEDGGVPDEGAGAHTIGAGDSAPSDASGCACRATPGAGHPPALLSAAAFGALVWWRTRTRKRRRS